MNGVNSTFVGYGPESLQPANLGAAFYPGVSSFNAYGAHFALELNEVLRTQEVSRARASVVGGTRSILLLDLCTAVSWQ